MKTYQSQLPMATAIKSNSPPKWVGDLRARLIEMFSTGFWHCQDCDHSTERVEGEQGQPAHCGRCGSHRIQWRDPIFLADGSKLIEPGDL